MADAFLLLRNGIDAGLQCFSPAQPGVDQISLASNPRPLGAPDDDRLQLLGAHHRAQAMSRRVVVVVDEHGSANEVFARWADGADVRVLVTRLLTYYWLRTLHAFSP